MHRVRLHDYLSRIERLIDDNRLSEAASHCHNVLRQYPLHVDTYRLYGRVLLEQQQYTQAIDIFERVASVDPEDLITHAGLALAYKENLNLPRAVWHMERAFEIDPYNRAIRDELAELFAARDGYTRDQIELTRPALARLYFKSTLYREAATEISSLLRKQPKRLDLKLLLADTFFWANRRADLIDICLEIVEGMPYSVKANAILAAEWMRNNRPTEANEHWRRVQALTLLTAGSVDPDTTLGKACTEAEYLSFPEVIAVEQLDDVSAVTPLSDRVDDLSSESEEAEGDAAMPGWLQEIGFMPVEMPADAIVTDDTVTQGDRDEQALDIDWEELAISVSESDERVESQLPDDIPEDLLVADLLAMVEDVETTAHDQTIAESLEALLDLETELAEEPIADLPIQYSPTLPHEMSLDDQLDQLVEQVEADSFAETPMEISFEEDLEDWTDALGDLSELVDELGEHRRGTTTILPPLESVEPKEKKAPDWMDDLAVSSDVDEVLPDWLIETVGFTDELFEASGEGPAGDHQEVDDQALDISNADRPDNSDISPTEEMASISEPSEMTKQELSLQADDREDSASDIPDWLLGADDVLDELPDEIFETSDDSWLEDMKEDEETATWLEEIKAEPSTPTDETMMPSGTGLTGFLSRGLGLEASDDASEETESELAKQDDEPLASDVEDAE